MARNKLRILHVVPRGLRGGIQSLIRDIVLNSEHENVLCTWHTAGPLNEELSEKGHEVLDYSGNSWLSVTKRLGKVIDKRHFDVVVNHNYSGKQSLMFALGDFGNCKVVQYLHSCYGPDCIRKPILKPFLTCVTSKAYKKASLTLAISKYVLNSHRNIFPYIVNPLVIYNGVDFDRFVAASNVNRALSTPIRILYLGRLTEVKGVQVLIDACAELQKDSVPFELTIAGWGDYEEQLINKTKAKGVEANFVGEAKSPEFFYGDADVFALSALWEEGFGITLVEAMASGCICIASDAGGIPEVIENGRSGFLVEQGCASAIANTIKMLAAMSADEIVEYRTTARMRAVNFGIDRYINKYDDAMRKLASNGF